MFQNESQNDLVGHGTAIAGIILGSKVLGLRGAAPGAELVPLVYYSRFASGVPLNGGINAICEAIYDAVDIYSCRIINISSGITDDNDKLREAIAYAEEKNVLVISSVGNTNRSSPKDIYYPAAYDTVVGVGAADEKNEVADFSQCNYSVKLLAPGTDIPTAPIDNSSKAVTVNGSSYAAAFVAGAAALLLEDNPELSASQLREILYHSAKNLGPDGYDTDTGWGLLDISKAIYENEKFMPFTDIAPDSWYYDAVLSEYRAGLFKGIATSKFLPCSAMNLAMFITLLYRLEKEPETTEKVSFKDVKTGSWNYAAICWAVEKGIVTGSNGYFRPDKALTRQDMTMLLYRYAQYKSIDVNGGSSFDLARYSDSEVIPDYAESAVKWACNAGILSGISESSLDLNGELTRAQAAVVIYCLLNGPKE